MTLARLASAVLALSFVAAAHAQPAPRRLTLDDYARVQGIADPQRSPDGAWVAYTLTTIEWCSNYLQPATAATAARQ